MATQEDEDLYCKRSRKCSKLRGHKGLCNSEKKLATFWENSPVFIANKRRRVQLDEENRMTETIREYESTASRFYAQVKELEDAKAELMKSLSNKDAELVNLNRAFEEKCEQIEAIKQEMSVKTQENQELKSMISSLGLDYKQFSKSKRMKNPTSKDMINDSSSSTRYRRRKETEKALTFIHGGEVGSLYGAWDYIVANAQKEFITEVFIGYKKGKHLQQLFGNSMKDYRISAEAMKHALALKYQNFLSRRKFTLVCKTQASYFNANKEIWLPKNINCLGLDLRHPQPVSSKAVDLFVKNLDIGDVEQLPGTSGVSRTITGLVFMIIDLHLRVQHLSKKLVWFNEMENHFIFQFSDDGAPETSDLTMSIGSVTMWNLGDRVRSRDFQYLLHCVSLEEKHQILEDLWKQHTDEMALLEGNVLTVAGKQCTVEFQPSADMSWQGWSNNELNSTDSKGKWWQLLRANYVRSFYLPENQPMPTTYKSHFQSRVPSHCDQPGFCNCGRKIENNVFCHDCLSSREIVTCAQNQELSQELIILLKPVSCEICGERFADKSILDSHLVIHNSDTGPLECSRKNPKEMSVKELKEELRKLNLSLLGRKDILIKRLESRLAGGC